MAAERAYFAPGSKAEAAGQAAGGVGEGVLEFVLGDEALKGLSIADKIGIAGKIEKVAKESPYIGALLRHGVVAARNGTVGTAEALAKGATLPEALKSGAETGLIGGTLGATGELAETAPSAAGRALAKGVAVGTAAGVGGVGAVQALTPKKEGETDQQELERRIQGAVQGLMGAQALTEAAPHIKEAAKNIAGSATAATRRALDLDNTLTDLVKKASPPTKGKSMEYGDTLKEAEPQLREVFRRNPDVSTPKEMYDALDEHIKEQEGLLQAKAEQYKGTARAAMPDLDIQVKSALNDAFKDSAGQYTPQEQRAATKAVLDHLHQEVGLDANGKMMYRNPDLFEAEGVRQRFNEDANPVFGSNAPSVPKAEAFAKAEAAKVLRNNIDAKYDELGVGNVKEWRKQEAALIDVRDQIANADKKANEMGEFNLWNSLTKQLGWKVPLAAMLGTSGAGLEGGAALAGGTALMSTLHDYLRDIKTNPNRLIQRAAKMANEEGPSGAAIPSRKSMPVTGEEIPTGSPEIDAAIKKGGAIPGGMMLGYVQFHDPITGSSLMLKPEDVSPESVITHMAVSRAKFGLTPDGKPVKVSNGSGALAGAAIAGGGAALLGGLASNANAQTKKSPFLVPGNIDVNHRPVIWNDDGSPSTIFSATIPIGNGKWALVPTIANGKFLTPSGKIPKESDKKAMQALEDAAAEQYKKTGQHLGIFNSQEAADAYAERTHAWMPDGSDKQVFTPSYSGESNMPLTKDEYEKELSKRTTSIHNRKQ